MMATMGSANRRTSFLLRAAVSILVVLILALSLIIARSLLTKNNLNAPRTELERAELSAVQAVKANPNDARSRIKLSAVYLEKGDSTSAIKEASNATRLAPDNAEGFYVYGLALEMRGDAAKARDKLLKAVKMTGQLASFYQTCWLEIAKIDNNKQDYKNAIKDYDAALGYGPESTPILYDLGVAYEKSGDKQNALAYYKEALEFVPDFRDAILAAGRLEKEGIKINPKTTAKESDANKSKQSAAE